MPSSDSTATDIRRSSDTLSLLITSSLDQAVFQAFDFNPNSVLGAQIYWDLSPNEKEMNSGTVNVDNPAASMFLLFLLRYHKEGPSREQISFAFMKGIAKLSKMFLTRQS